MLKDSRQLASLKDKIAHEVTVQSSEKTATPTGRKESAVAGSAPALAPKTPGKETGTKKPSKSARIRKEAPEKPAADLEDVRRSTRVI
jgi:hypothetical protein